MDARRRSRRPRYAPRSSPRRCRRQPRRTGAARSRAREQLGRAPRGCRSARDPGSRPGHGGRVPERPRARSHRDKPRDWRNRRGRGDSDRPCGACDQSRRERRSRSSRRGRPEPGRTALRRSTSCAHEARTEAAGRVASSSLPCSPSVRALGQRCGEGAEKIRCRCILLPTGHPQRRIRGTRMSGPTSPSRCTDTESSGMVLRRRDCSLGFILTSSAPQPYDRGRTRWARVSSPEGKDLVNDDALVGQTSVRWPPCEPPMSGR